MFLSKRTTAWFVASMALFGVLALASFAAPPPGKGGGGGGSSPPPPSLPADLDVRYRVQFIPLPTIGASNSSNYHVIDVNDVHEVVGGYHDEDGIRVGFYYDADAQKLLTANQMTLIPDLPAEWVETSFHGINNHGTIVGMVQDGFGFHQCILIFPNSDGTYSYEISSPVDTDGNPIDSYFMKINDFGDIVGVSWDDALGGTAFAHNPAINVNFIPFGPPGVNWESIRVTDKIDNRLAVSWWGDDDPTWFDFLKPGTLDPEPLPAIRFAYGLSNDGQITVNEAQVVKKGKNYSYRYTPGIMVDGQYVWQGNLDDGYATLVNSAVGTNPVGDVVGYNEISRVRWLRYADRPDWGYLDLGAMVVFSTVADEERWSLITGGVRVWEMSDRDETTGFGMLAGEYNYFAKHDAYVLVPEIVPQQ